MTTRSRLLFNPARLFGGVVLVAVLGSAALSAWAQPGGHGGHGEQGLRGGAGMMGLPMHGRMVERMLDSVNATAEQRAQVKQIAEHSDEDHTTEQAGGVEE